MGDAEASTASAPVCSFRKLGKKRAQIRQRVEEEVKEASEGSSDDTEVCFELLGLYNY